jgi:integrating conjugative element protein (TIGR03765 family)
MWSHASTLEQQHPVADVRRTAQRIIVTTLLSYVVVGYADIQATDPLEQIYDSGRSVPIAPYMSGLVNTEPDGQGNVKPGQRFPILTRLRQAALAQEVQVLDPRWLTQPIALIGIDRHSLAWLLMHQDQLAAMHAKVLVIQALEPRHIRMAQAVVPRLDFLPQEGPWLEARLREAGAGVFPLLIGTDGVARQILPLPPVAQQVETKGQP